MRTITKIIIHCAATPEGKNFTAEDIDRWHKERDFSGIGYHYVVLLDGTIEEGRALDKTGAHCLGYNTGSIGICYIGGCDQNGNPKDTRTPKQKDALEGLVLDLQKRFPKATVHGHNEFSTKACPSFIVAGEFGSLNHKSGQVTGIYGRGDVGGSVNEIQSRLNELGYNLVVDGIFGLETDTAIRQFQEINELTIDGLVGGKTFDKLFSITAKEKSISKIRKNTTSSQLAKKSRIIKFAKRSKLASLIITLFGGIAVAGNTLESVGIDHEFVKLIANQDHKAIVGVAIAALLNALFADKIEAARLEDHKTGKTV